MAVQGHYIPRNKFMLEVPTDYSSTLELQPSDNLYQLFHNQLSWMKILHVLVGPTKSDCLNYSHLVVLTWILAICQWNGPWFLISESPMCLDASIDEQTERELTQEERMNCILTVPEYSDEIYKHLRQQEVSCLKSSSRRWNDIYIPPPNT